jgi:hypothetical protein
MDDTDDTEDVEILVDGYLKAISSSSSKIIW